MELSYGELQAPSFGVRFLQSGGRSVLSWDREIDTVIIGRNEMVVTRPGCNQTKLGKPRVTTKAALVGGQ